MHHSSLTAIVPAYNAAGTLPKALASIRAQTRPPDEIIVVDDGSSDDTPTIAADLGVRVHRLPTNLGAGSARNEGLGLARGELIAWLDADDSWEPMHCELVAGLLERFPEASVAFGGVTFEGTRSGEWLSPLPDGVPTDAFWLSFASMIVPQMTAVTRRDAVLEVAGYDTRLDHAQDFDLFLRMARKRPFVSTQRVTGRYRYGAAQERRYRAQLRQVFHCRRAMLDEVVGEGNQELADRIARKMFELWLYSTSKALQERDLRRLVDVLALGRVVPEKRAHLGRTLSAALNAHRARDTHGFTTAKVEKDARGPRDTRHDG